MRFTSVQDKIIAWAISTSMLTAMENAMDKNIKNLLGICLLVWIASVI